MATPMTAEELNALAKQTGYQPVGGSFSDVGLAKPVSVLSSSTGQNIVNQNTGSLQKIESGYMGPSIVDYLNSAGQGSDINSRANLAKQYGVSYDTKATGDKSAQQNTQLLQALRNVSSSPASNSMVTGINGAVSGGIGMTEAEKIGLSGVQSSEDALTEAAAKARAALESKDYRDMDYWTAKAEENRKQYEADLTDYYKSTKDLRNALTTSMVPGAKEQDLTNRLNTIRNQAEQFKIQTEEDKLKEYEGQTLGFAGGRANEIDRKAEFKLMRMAAEEKNLLLSLGLEQEVRKAQGKGAELQLGFLHDDFELQTKVQDKLDAMEEDLFNKANTLQDDAKSTLVSIIDELQGVDPSKMDAASLKQLQDLAARSGLPFNLITQALQTQYAKRVFDQAKENKPTSDEKDSAEVSRVGSVLNKAKGGDGYTDPNLYARERAASSLSPTDFDNRFGYLVNPESRARLGITSAISGNDPGSVTGADLTKITNYVLNNGGNAADLERAKTDRDFQAWIMGKLEE